MKKRINVEIVIKIIVAVCMLGAVVYGFAMGNFLLCVKCGAGAALVFLPDLIYTLGKKKIGPVICSLFYVFLFCAIFCGEVFGAYGKITHWDTFLHAFSGSVLTAFGFALVNLLNDRKKVKGEFGIFFTCLFAFSFALAAGAVWEIYEYTFDGLLGMNMQRFMTYEGVVLSGHEALYDTMKDIIIDCVAALITAVVGGVGMKIKRNRFPRKNGET